MPDVTNQICVTMHAYYDLAKFVSVWQPFTITNCTLPAGTYWLAFEKRNTPLQDWPDGTVLYEAPSTATGKSVRLITPATDYVLEKSSTGRTTSGRGMRLSGTRTTITPRTLTVTLAGNVSGTVTSDPAGVACTGTTCTKTYTDATENVVLTAIPLDANSTATWTGCDTTSGNTCTINMSGGDKGVTVTFFDPSKPTSLLYGPSILETYTGTNTTAIQVDDTKITNALTVSAWVIRQSDISPYPGIVTDEDYS